MCGICGIVLADTAAQVSIEMIGKMMASIIHRGPDEKGLYVEGAVGLGMRRLSIIDIEGGHQPIANEDATVRVVYNGEIYNHHAVRRELEAAGHCFRTRSDTEVIVHAYEDDGADCVQRLRGMFSLALWDSRRRRLLLAVDRFGIKPLYYAVREDGIAFGSELQCLLLAGRSSRRIDSGALAQYFTLGYVPPPATIFEDVRKLAPGTLLEWMPERARLHRYWESPYEFPDRERRPAETRAQLLHALRDSVRTHLVSDVPVGAFLSGGIDSSALVALMSECTDEPVRTFSIGFANRRFSELDNARLVAQRYRTDHHELIVEPASVELLPRIATHFGEPFADASALPTYHVSKLAHEHVKVALSGDGGDELFLGYTTFLGLKLARHAQSLPPALRGALASLPGRVPRLARGSVGDRIDLLLKRAADSSLPPHLAFKRKISMPGILAIMPLLSKELAAELAVQDPFAVVDGWLHRYAGSSTSHPLDPFARTGLQISLPGDMLVKVDRMSMANSLEVRVPLLDHVLAEFVATIPLEQRMPRWRLKGLLRDTVAHLLPPPLLRQRKRGFVVPLADWFRGDIDSLVREVLLSDDVRRRGYLDTDAMETMIGRHRGGAANLGSTIWSLLMFELWCQQALDAPAVPRESEDILKRTWSSSGEQPVA